jgi:hypothetical protein
MLGKGVKNMLYTGLIVGGILGSFITIILLGLSKELLKEKVQVKNSNQMCSNSYDTKREEDRTSVTATIS